MKNVNWHNAAAYTIIIACASACTSAPPPVKDDVPVRTDVKNYRTAAVYVSRSDDRFVAKGNAYAANLRCLVNQWPAGAEKPNWFGQLLIGKPFDPSTVHADTAAKPYSLTTYFYQMSGGRYWMYGEEIAYTGKGVRKKDKKSAWRKENEKVMRWFIEEHDARKYDNDGDGYVDMIMMLNRARRKFPYGRQRSGSYQGVANGDYLPPGLVITDPRDPSEPKFRVHTSPKLNSGLYQTDVYALSHRNIILHEIGHKLLNVGHRNKLHRWNLMSGSGQKAPSSSGLVMSAYEKMRMGWLDPIEINRDTIGVQIGDLTGQNQAVKIPYGSGHFLLEYRKNQPRFEIVQEDECASLPGLGEGLLVSWATGRGEPSIIPADGIVQRAKGGFDGDHTDLFGARKSQISPYTGKANTTVNRRRTGLAILNVREEDDSVTFDVRRNYWRGKMDRNAVWQDDVYVDGALTVPKGVRLTIRPGVKVTFAEGGAMTIIGQLTAAGQAQKPIRFVGDNGKSWKGITVTRSAMPGELKHALLENASSGITDAAKKLNQQAVGVK